MSRSRAQSEVVGIVILIGVVVTVVGIVSVVILSNVGTESSPVADFRIEADATDVRVTHLGGDQIPAEDLVVVARGPDGQTRSAVGSGMLRDDDGDEVFEFGEAIVVAHGRSGGDGRVLVVHRPTGAVVDEAWVSFSAG